MSNKIDLTGKVAVVTGASTKIGADAAMAYAEAGANVALLSDNETSMAAVKAEIENMGGRVIAVPCDITNDESVKEAIDTIVDAFGQIDILLNNSEIFLRDGLEKMTDAEWNKAIGSVLRSIFFVSRQVMPQMKKGGFGRIINVSTANSRTEELRSRWSKTSKTTIADLTKGLSYLFAQDGITINTVGPENALNCMENASDEKKDEFYGTVLYLSSEEASVVRGQFVDTRCAKAIA